MNFGRELKWQPVLYAILYILMGIILLLFPDTTARSLCYLVGGAAIGVGVFTVLSYLFREAYKNNYRNDFVNGLIAVMIGIFVLYKAELVIALIPFLLGIFVVISGFIKLQSCIDLRRMGFGSGLVLFILAIINIVMGIVLVVNPSWIVRIVFQLIGAGLLFSGVTDIGITFYMMKKVKDYRKNVTPLNDILLTEEAGRDDK